MDQQKLKAEQVPDVRAGVPRESSADQTWVSKVLVVRKDKVVHSKPVCTLRCTDDVNRRSFSPLPSSPPPPTLSTCRWGAALRLAVGQEGDMALMSCQVPYHAFRSGAQAGRGKGDRALVYTKPFPDGLAEAKFLNVPNQVIICNLLKNITNSTNSTIVLKASIMQILPYLDAPHP